MRLAHTVIGGSSAGLAAAWIGLRAIPTGAPGSGSMSSPWHEAGGVMALRKPSVPAVVFPPPRAPRPFSASRRVRFSRQVVAEDEFTDSGPFRDAADLALMLARSAPIRSRAAPVTPCRWR